MKKYHLPVFGLALMTMLPHAHALSGKGETGTLFLSVPVSARAVALGGGLTGVGGDVSTMDYNPAGLMGGDRIDINLSHKAYIEGSALESVALSAPFNFNIWNNPQSLRDLDRERFVAAGQYRLFHSKDIERSEYGADMGEFQIRDECIHIALAYGLSPRISLGGAGKYIRKRLKDENANDYGFDGGVQWKVTNALNLGASILNLGSSKAYIEDADPLPTTARLGTFYETKRVNLLLDLSQGREKITQISGGVEYKVNRLFCLRAGALHHTSFEMSGGFGFRFSDNKIPTERSSSEEPANPQESRIKRYRLGEPETATSHLRKPRQPARIRTLEFGLDYAANTNNDLGITHTITLKVLY